MCLCYFTDLILCWSAASLTPLKSTKIIKFQYIFFQKSKIEVYSLFSRPTPFLSIYYTHYIQTVILFHSFDRHRHRSNICRNHLHFTHQTRNARVLSAGHHLQELLVNNFLRWRPETFRQFWSSEGEVSSFGRMSTTSFSELVLRSLWP